MLKLLSQHACFGGVQRFYQHQSIEIGLPMRFSVFLPPETEALALPSLFYLAGLTCTEETFPIKAGAQRFAAHHGIALIAPDTSPRGAGIPGESDNWDFGVGAGFYVDATEEPWSRHYRMYSYLVHELLPTVQREFRLDPHRTGIFGHSMGGHGALTIALRNPDLFRSVSAFAPIAAPMQCTWGEQAFSHYLGPEREAWKPYDACELIARSGKVFPEGILIDQGLDDQFLEDQLNPKLFADACGRVGQPATVRRHPGYDHGYYFISTFMADHIAHHARILRGDASSTCRS